MESPYGRPEICDFIGDIIDEYRARPEGICGGSLELTIYNALKKADYLTDKPDHCPWDCSYCHDSDGVCEDEDGIPIENWGE